MNAKIPLPPSDPAKTSYTVEDLTHEQIQQLYAEARTEDVAARLAAEARGYQNAIDTLFLESGGRCRACGTEWSAMDMPCPTCQEAAEARGQEQGRQDLVRARSGLSNHGLPLWRHECGYVEAFTDSDLSELDGCDACGSGSDNPFEWQPLYLAADFLESTGGPEPVAYAGDALFRATDSSFRPGSTGGPSIGWTRPAASSTPTGDSA